MRKLISTIRTLVVLPLLVVSLPSLADPYTDNAAVDELFAELRVASSETEANLISRQIWELWFKPNDPDLSRKMGYVSISMSSGEVMAALSELDSIVAEFPDYAEGWNQRATVHFMLGNLEDSLADIDKVLAIEPRHYGALSGRVLIYLQQGKRELALKDMVAALAIHPYLSERRYFPELAQDVTRI